MAKSMYCIFIMKNGLSVILMNIAEIAQLVEQKTENLCVTSSILVLSKFQNNTLFFIKLFSLF